MISNLQSIVFGSGCFWCTEAIFKRVKGVQSAVSGYAGGHTKNPDYYSVVSGSTGHAEVIKVEFDPTQVSFEDLLEIFFATHDPTTLNAQGADRGTQYRSIILTATPEQLTIAQNYIKNLTTQKAYSAPITTELKPLNTFTPAEISHQEYYDRQTEAPYCQVVIAPKIAKFLQKFKDKTK